MKIARPLKYVLTAAAVCIMCFSGSSEYFFTVLAITTENDVNNISDELQRFDEFSEKNEPKKEKIRNYNCKKNLYTPTFLLIDINKCEHNYQQALHYNQQSFSDTENKKINDLFAVKLHGIRSP